MLDSRKLNVGPYREVALVQHRGGNRWPPHIVIRTVRGWYVGPPVRVQVLTQPKTSTPSLNGAAVLTLRVGPMLRISIKADNAFSYGHEALEADRFCAVRDDRLACTRDLITRFEARHQYTEDEKHLPLTTGKARFDIQIGDDGVLTVAPVGKAPRELSRHVGRHVLDSL